MSMLRVYSVIEPSRVFNFDWTTIMTVLKALVKSGFRSSQFLLENSDVHFLLPASNTWLYRILKVEIHFI